jgi:mRNA interferase MazF
LVNPERGQIIKINFDPQKGREQTGYRPALVISQDAYNARTGMLLACPITSKAKGYSTEVSLPKSLNTKGVILTTQIKALDWHERDFKIIESVDESVLDEVLDTLIAVIE